MKKIWGLGTLVVSCCVGLTQVACSGSGQSGGGGEQPEPRLDDLLGGVAVSSRSLDAVGALGIAYSYDGGFGSAGAPGAGAPSAGGASGAFSVAGAGGSTPGGSFSPSCTGTLISKNSVLTSRNCAWQFQSGYYGGRFVFAMGANAYQPERIVDVVEVEFAPPAIDTSSGYPVSPDLAVLHLAESITDVTPFKVALLGDDLLGKPLAVLGFGSSDLRYFSGGSRRAGALTLRSNGGLLYPLIFSDFEAFYQYSLNGGYPGYPGAGGAVGAAGAPSLPFDPGSGGQSSGGTAGALPIGGSAPTAGSAGGGGDWYREYLLQQYNSVALEIGESYLGGTDSDAQPCGADQGGPLMRKQGGQVRVFGVFSRTPFGGCDKGAIAARITPAAKAFVDAAAQWTDPCGSTTANGQCTGNTAVRCSNQFEGKRRLVKFDCNLLAQVCVGGGFTEVACSDN